MNKLFYPKLAFHNMQKNRKFYLPYLFTCIATIAMYYIMCSIAGNEGLKKMPGQDALIAILGFGTGTIAVFAVIFLFYTNSFLMKRRKKELGLYNILGMEKQHIFKVLFFETVYLAIASMVTGLAAGILLDKIMILTLYRILRFSVPMGFYISKAGILKSIVLFAFIFVLILISNLIQIGKAKPVDLLQGGSVGEKEPKAKWFLALVGVVSIGAAYYISITTKSPLTAITLFFFAVLLVIMGTYCLFTAGSIVVLKLLKKNKKYYYQTKHFVSISGMIYRMKQNAVGLSNICILSTMVLVMVSTTVSLYIGEQDILDTRFQYDITAEIDTNTTDFEKEKMMAEVKKVAEKEGRKIDRLEDSLSLSIALKNENGNFLYEVGTDFSQMAIFTILTKEEYENLTGESEEDFGANEILLYHKEKNTLKEINLGGEKYNVKKNLTDFPNTEEDAFFMVDAYYMVVKDDKTIEGIYQAQKKAFGENASNLTYEIRLDIDGTKEEKISCADAVSKALKTELSAQKESTDKKETAETSGYHVESKQKSEDDFYSLYGGFLFLGIFLGILFLMATTLIIYYKQISEGYADKERFEIMEKVGMTKKEVKGSIRSQVLKVFFLPIAVAAIHVAAAFPLVTRLLAMFGLMNTTLFMACTIGTIVVFAVIYGVVYMMTARVYYKIVS